MIFNTAPNPLDRDYNAGPPPGEEPNIEEPILGTGDIGSTTFESPGQQDLIQGLKAEIRKGVGKIELATGLGGPTSPVGAESYGEEARQAFREMRQAADIDLTSVHVPTQVNGLSGYNPQQGGFSDEARKMGTDEISKAVRFAAEAAGGGAVVVHTSEFDRPVSEEDWAKKKVGERDGKPVYDYEFMSSIEEPRKATFGVVDKKSGKVQNIAQKNMTIERPVWKRAEQDYEVEDPKTHQHYTVRAGDFVDLDGLPAPELKDRVPEMKEDGSNEFKTQKYTWEDIEEEAHQQGKEAALHFYETHMEKQVAQRKGQALYYSQGYQRNIREREKIKNALQFYEELESNMSEEERWKLQQTRRPFSELVPPGTAYPTEMLKEQLEQVDQQLRFSHEAAAMAEAEARQMQEEISNYTSLKEYALQQTEKTLGQAAAEAYEQTKNNQHSQKPVFISVENWDPNMYGAHPDELLEIIDRGRKKMVEYLTSKELEDNGSRMVNPYYVEGLSKGEAAKLAEQHVKMTFDTEHLALWRKKFQPKQGETREQMNERFNNWYLEQVDKLAKSNVIGHVHFVDSIEGGHQHIPAGEGELPLKQVAEKLKEHGVADSIVSEGHSENMRFGPARQVTKAWENMGSNMYTMIPGAPHPTTFGQTTTHYYGRMRPPLFMFGAYVPSNDYQLWSEVPME